MPSWDAAGALPPCSAGTGTYGTQEVVAAVMAQAWNPPSVAVAETVEAMRRDGEIPKGVHALVLDADDAITKCWEYGAFACPAVVLMRGDGTLMTVQRPLVGDDCKVSGPLSKALILQLLRAAADAAANGRSVVVVDW